VTVVEPTVPAMKVCYRCRVSKDDSEFNKSTKNRDGLHSYCRECQKAHYRDNYARHLANVRRTSDARTARTRAVIGKLLQTGCVDCGNRDIRVLEFDHVRGEKVRGVGELVSRGASLEVILAEIEKCEIRCRNCHVIATFTRRGRTWHDDYL